MDIKIIVDRESELRMNQAAERLEDHLKKNKIKSLNKDIIVIFSNSHEFIEELVIKLPPNTIAINITENLSEQHIINTLKYVSDICYLKTDVTTIASRIITAYNRNKVKLRNAYDS